MTDMMALRAHARGGPEQLAYEQAPMPDPKTGEVVIAVYAAGITFGELGWDPTWTRDGKDRTPIVPSHEVSGRVAEIGPGVMGLRGGDEVYGLIRFDRDGAAAEYVAVPAADVVRKPITTTHVQTAALPLAALTAWQALVDHAAVHPKERVLVHGGAGGVGAFAVQLASHFGAVVTATCRAADVDFVRDLGAQRVINFEAEEFDADGEEYDVVIDTASSESPDRSFPVLRRGGRLITLQAPASDEEAGRHGVKATFFIVTPNADELSELATLVDKGKLHVNVAETFPLSEGRAAYERGAVHGRLPGKTVLVVR
jgi:NADPH:quinone reductase-like Zn-dependent oxidoreductase